MFCDQCGNECLPTIRVCPKCGCNNFSSKNLIQKTTKNQAPSSLTSTPVNTTSSNNTNVNQPTNLFWLIPIIVMSIGLFPLPYGYYSFLRLVVCGFSCFYAYCLWENHKKIYAIIFSLVALLYNPIIPVHLYEKEIWILINIFTSILFFWKRKYTEF